MFVFIIRTMCNQIISPRHHHDAVFTSKEDDNNRKNEYSNDMHYYRKLSLIEEDINEQNTYRQWSSSSADQVEEGIDALLEYPGEIKQILDHNYLCVIASPRYKKSKPIYQKEDEYWFMVPISRYHTGKD